MGNPYIEHTTNADVFAWAGCKAMLEQQVQCQKLQYFAHVVRQKETFENSITLGILPSEHKELDSNDCG